MRMFTSARSASRTGTVALLALLVACSGDAEPRPGPAAAESLRAIMQAMDSAASEIAGGIWTEDHDRVAAGAAAIAGHPPIPDAERQAIQETLGEAFAAFARMDQQVHDVAVALGRLAQERAAIGDVLSTFQQLQAGCVGCHTAFRPRVATALASEGS